MVGKQNKENSKVFEKENVRLAEEGYYAISLTESWKNLKLRVF